MSHVEGAEISLCKVHDMHLLGSGYRQQGIDAKDASSSILIHNNEIYGGTSAGIYIDSASANVYNNYIHDITGSTISTVGLLIGNETEAVTNVSGSIYNNIFDTCGTSIAVRTPNLHDDGTDTYTLNFINNTIWNDGYTDHAPITLEGAAADYTSCVVRNNIIFSIVGYLANLLYIQNSPTGITIDHNSFYNLAGIDDATYLGSSAITSNPLLSDPPSADFRILSASPCKDIASSTGAPATDYAGTARPQGSGYDIGAYEYIVFAPTPTITPTASPTPQFTNTTAYSDGVIGINGLIIIMFAFMGIFAIVLLLNSGQNIIVALIAAAVIIYLVVAFLPGINEVINTVFGLSS